jgi:FMN reductase
MTDEWHKEPIDAGVGGTTRPESKSERTLRRALAVTQRARPQMQILAGATLNLPPYEPANPVRSLAALALVDALGRADGIIVKAPRYHDSIPGFFEKMRDNAGAAARSTTRLE